MKYQSLKYFVTLAENTSGMTNDTRGSWKYLHHRIAVETHFYKGHGNETISVFLPADGKASYLVLPTLASLISDGTVQSENAPFFLSLQRGKCHPIIKTTNPLL